MATNNEILTRTLVGNRLSSITFVEDYIQFGFDDARLSAFTLPVLTSRIGIPDSDKGALCELIGSIVAYADEKADEHVSIGFEDGAILTIPLDDASRNQVEAGTLMAGGHTLIVW